MRAVQKGGKPPPYARSTRYPPSRGGSPFGLRIGI